MVEKDVDEYVDVRPNQSTYSQQNICFVTDVKNIIMVHGILT